MHVVHSMIDNFVSSFLDGYGRKLIGALRQGFGTAPSGAVFPLTLGRDFSGIVKETGRGVSRFKPGDEVSIFAPYREYMYWQANEKSDTYSMCFNCFLASCSFCHLLITHANSLDADQD